MDMMKGTDPTGKKYLANYIGNLRESNNGFPVNLQDQTTKPVLLNFNQVLNSTTLKSAATKDTKTIQLNDTTGTGAGKYIIIFDPSSLNFSFYTQIGATAGDTITLDSSLDYSYPAGANVDISTIAMNVNGSVTPKTFGLRGTGVPPGVELSVDITEISFYCVAASPVYLSLFGDLPALTNGMVIRKRDGDFTNIINIKNNAKLASYSRQYEITQALNPAQGEDGFYGSIYFAGQDNVGVAIRLEIGEDLEIIVQDPLQTLTFLEFSAIGHVVQN